MKQSRRAVVTRQLVRRGPRRACPGILLLCSWNQVDLWGPARLTYASPLHQAWAWKPVASLFTSSYDSNYPVKFICAFALQGVLSSPDTKLLSTTGDRLGQEVQHPGALYKAFCSGPHLDAGIQIRRWKWVSKGQSHLTISWAPKVSVAPFQLFLPWKCYESPYK